MKSGIIHSGALRTRNPYLAFLLSFLFPGLGQIYNSDVSKGVIYFCGLTVVAFISPLYLTESAESSYLLHASLQYALYVLVWISSPVEAFFRAKHRGSIMLRPFNSFRVYAAFALISAATTAITVFMTVTFFSVVTAQGNVMEPTFSRNEILLCNRFSIRFLQGGDTVLYRHEGSFRIGRILAKGGDTIAYTHNTFMVNNIPLSLGVFTDAGRSERGLENDTRLFSELNGNRKYSVYHNIEKEIPLIPEGTVLKVGKQHFFITGDNRTGKFSYSMPHADSIVGRIEGILAGTSLRRYLQKTFITVPVRQ